MKRVTYLIGQAVRLMLSAAAAFAAGFFLFDWMAGIFEPLSAAFVLALCIGLGGCVMFLALDKLTVRRRDR